MAFQSFRNILKTINKIIWFPLWNLYIWYLVFQFHGTRYALIGYDIPDPQHRPWCNKEPCCLGMCLMARTNTVCAIYAVFNIQVIKMLTHMRGANSLKYLVKLCFWYPLIVVVF